MSYLQGNAPHSRKLEPLSKASESIRMAVAPMSHSRFTSNQKKPFSRFRYFASSACSRRSAVLASPQARAAAARNAAKTVSGTCCGFKQLFFPATTSVGSLNLSRSSFAFAAYHSSIAVSRFSAQGSYQSNAQASKPQYPRG